MPSQYVRLERFKPGSDEWHDQRAERVGGSEIGAVLGISPHDSAYGLWHRKKGLAPPVEENDAMWWGTQFEPIIAHRFASNHPEFLVQRTSSFALADQPEVLATPDRRVLTVGAGSVPLEIKKARYDDEWGRGEEDIPPHYHAQQILQMGVWGVDHGYMAALISGADYREYRIGFDQSTFDMLVGAIVSFVESMRLNQRPPIDGSVATYEVIKYMHPEIEDRIVDLDVDDPDGVIRYLAAREGFAAAELEKQHATNFMAELMGSAKTAMVGKKVIARRQAKMGGTPYVVAGRSLPRVADLAALVPTEENQ